MKNKYSLDNNSDDVLIKKNTGVNKTISTTVSNSTKEYSSNGKNETFTTLLDQDEKIQKNKVASVEIINDDVTNGIKNFKENKNENEIYKLLIHTDVQDEDRRNSDIMLTSTNMDTNFNEKENLSSTLSHAREDSIAAEVKETMQSPANTDNELGKFFTEEEKGTVITTNKNVKEILERGMQYKHRGNSLFKKNKFRDSLNEYLTAVEEINGLLLLKTQSSLNVTNINWLRLECMNNIAVCYLLLKEFNKVLYYTQQVLSINPNNVNSLSYRAKALISLQLYKEAVYCIKKALSIKYSKRLMTLLKEIEGKVDLGAKDLRDGDHDIDEKGSTLIKNSPQFSTVKIDVKNQIPSKEISRSGSESDVKKIEKKKTSFKKSFFFSFLLTILKFSKILSIGLIEFLKRHKYGILILIVIWIITFRTSFKNKLLNMLRIRFN